MQALLQMWRRDGMGAGVGVSAMAAVALLGLAVPADAATRTWIGGNADWTSAFSNWTGNDEPDSNDDAVFNTANSVDMAINNQVLSLALSNGIDLFTIEQFLQVTNGVTLSGSSTNLGVGGNNHTPPANGMDAGDITINSGARLSVGGTRIDIAKGGGESAFDINTGGTLYGNGTLQSNDLAGATFSMLTNDGTLRVGNYQTSGIVFGAPPARTLSINAADTADARIDLDGVLGNGVVDVTRNATLDINVKINDDFDGTMTLRHDSTLNMNSTWGLGAGGVINIDNGFVDGGIFPDTPAGTATLDGFSLTNSGGTINVLDSDGTLVLSSGYGGIMGTLDNSNGGTVVFNRNSVLNNGHDYLLGLNSQSVVEGFTLTVNDDDFDMDGTGGSDWTIRNGGQLNIRGANMDGAGADDFGGTIRFEDDVAGGADQILDIDIADGNASLNTIVAASGTGRIKSADNDNIELRGSANVLSGAKLVLDSNAITFAINGSLIGAGEAFFDEPVIVADNTTFSVNSLDIDNVNGSLRVNPDATLTITSNSIESVNSLITINGGTIDASTSYNFANTGALMLIESFTSTNPRYTGTGTPTFLSGSALVSSSDGADFASNGVFREGSTIDLFSLSSRLTLGDAGKTIQLDGGDVISTGNNTRLTPQGTLSVTGDSTITVDTLDWDAGTTVVESGGKLSIDVGTVDVGNNVQDGTITLNSGNLDVKTTAGEWTMEANLNLSNTASDIPIITGDRILIGNDTGTADANLTVAGAGVSRIDAPVTFNADADVFIDAGAELITRNGGTIFTPANGANNGSFTGKGKWRIVGAQFDEATTINMTSGEVALDGTLWGGIFAGDADVNADLTINADTFEDFGHTAAIGQSEINIANTARLTINLDNPNDAWNVLSNGIINYTGDATTNNFLAGNAINMGGTMQISGDGRSNARLNITGTINLITAGEGLRLGSSDTNNTIAGGTINGPGTLFGDASRDLTGHGTINTDIAFSGGSSDLRADGGVLDINGNILAGLGTLRTTATGTLDLQNNFSSSNTSNGISMGGGTLQGAGTITLGNRNLRGRGTVLSKIVNDNSIISSGGTLVLNNAANDLDGFGGDGILRATSGQLRLINHNLADDFGGDLIINAGATFNAAGTELQFESTGDLIFDGGTYASDTAHQFEGRITVNANSRINTPAVAWSFTAGSTSTLNADLRVNAHNGFIENGATLSGGGSLTIDAGSTMRSNSGATISTLVINNGTWNISPANTIGTTTMQDFQQNASGQLDIDLGGTGLAQFDRLSVNGSAFLDGTLDVDLIGGFVPSLGNTFALLTALNVSGTFASQNLPGLGAGLDWAINYNPTSVVLEIVNAVLIAGDFNGSGQVEQGDLDLVLQNWGDDTAVTGIPAGWINDNAGIGQIEQTELDKVLQNWGATSAPDFAGSAVPEPATLALLVLGGLAMLRRRAA